MINVVVEIEAAEVLAKLQQLEKSTADLGPVLLAIGETLTESTKQRFASGTGPDGKKWDANSEVTIERKGRDQPLIEEGSLGEQISYAVDGNQLEIGSSLEYAAMQQFGGTKDEFPHLWGDIPARPFLGISDDDAKEILEIVESQIN